MNNPIVFTDIYELAYLEKVKKNVKDLRYQLDQSPFPEEWLKEKIINWSNKYGFDYDEVLEHLHEDRFFHCGFAKDPSKQAFHEKTAAKYIPKEYRDLVQNFENLDNGGPKSLSIRAGLIIPHEVTVGSNNKTSKTIDFKWQTGETMVYASHKHTKTDGGTQNLQFDDVKSSLDEARGINTGIFIAICDGAYYKRSYDSKTTRLQYLQNTHCCNNVFATDIYNLREILLKYI